MTCAIGNCSLTIRAALCQVGDLDPLVLFPTKHTAPSVS
jgi:hypothetical protein